jgi:hypothetical protein
MMHGQKNIKLGINQLCTVGWESAYVHVCGHGSCQDSLKQYSSACICTTNARSYKTSGQYYNICSGQHTHTHTHTQWTIFLDLRSRRVQVQFYHIWDNTSFFLECQAVTDGDGCKSKYCLSVPSASHIGLWKTMYYLKYKIGLVPISFSGPDLMFERYTFHPICLILLCHITWQK